MRQYSVWQAIFMSFYSRKLYRDVAFNWGGFAFLYLLLLVSLSVVSWTYKIQQAVNQAYLHASEKFIPQIPVLTLKNGKISTPEKRPYLIKSDNGKEIIAIIDTSGKYKSLKDTKASLLITETELYTAPKATETRIDKVPADVSLVFDPVVVNQYVKNVFAWTWLLVFPLLVVMLYLYRLIQAIVYAVLGRLYGMIIGARVTYAQVLQIALVSITPVIVLATLFDVFGFALSNAMIWGFIVGIAYLFYGVSANKR